MRHFFGIEDEEFIRGDVPMTKREIRMAVLNEARVQEDSYVLDVARYGLNFHRSGFGGT